MFYVSNLLVAKGALSTVWIAAFNAKKVDNKMAEKVSVDKSAHLIQFPGDKPFALRFSAQLLLGLVRIYQQKIVLLHAKCDSLLVDMRKNSKTPSKKNAKSIDLPMDEKANTTLAANEDVNAMEVPIDEDALMKMLMGDEKSGGLKPDVVVTKISKADRAKAAEAEANRLADATAKIGQAMEDVAPAPTASDHPVMPDDDFQQPDLMPDLMPEAPVPGTGSQDAGTAPVPGAGGDGDVEMGTGTGAADNSVDISGPGQERAVPERESTGGDISARVNDSLLAGGNEIEPKLKAGRPSELPALPDDAALNTSKPVGWDVLDDAVASAPEPEKKQRKKRGAEDESQATVTGSEEEKKSDERKKKKAKIQPVVFDARIELTDEQVRDYEKNTASITNTDRPTLLDERRERFGAATHEAMREAVRSANGVLPASLASSSLMYPTLFMRDLSDPFGRGSAGSRAAINPTVLEMYARVLTSNLEIDSDEKDWKAREEAEREADKKGGAVPASPHKVGGGAAGGADISMAGGDISMIAGDTTQADGSVLGEAFPAAPGLDDEAPPVVVDEQPAPAAADSPAVPGTPQTTAALKPLAEPPIVLLAPPQPATEEKDADTLPPPASPMPLPPDAALNDSRSRASDISTERTKKAWQLLNVAFGEQMKRGESDPKLSLFSLLKPIGAPKPVARRDAVALFYQVLELSDTPKQMLSVSQSAPYADITIKRGPNFEKTQLLTASGAASSVAVALASAAPKAPAPASTGSAGSLVSGGAAEMEAEDEPIAATSVGGKKGRGRKKH